MQDFEYRVWNEHDQRMESVIGILWKNSKMYQIATEEFQAEKGQLMYYSPIFTKRWLVPLQYIGIKDIHGKKVFRGDIVKVERILYTDCYRKEVEDIIEFIGEVVWQGFGWAVAEKVKEGIHYHLLWLWNIDNDKNDTMEILGNRWGNPELKVIA